MDGRNESEEMDSLFRGIDFLAGKAGLERRLQARIWERVKEDFKMAKINQTN